MGRVLKFFFSVARVTSPAAVSEKASATPISFPEI